MYIWSIEVSRSIHEGKWIAIKYKNENQEETSFWCVIKDINPKKKLLTVDVYNSSKTPNFNRDFHIYFDRITQANVIEGSFSKIQSKLIDKINSNIEDYLFLEYARFEDKLLNYYNECYLQDNDPSQTQYTVVEGIDIENFDNTNQLQLTDEQFEDFIKTLNNQLNIKRKNNSIYEKVIFNYLSVFNKTKGIIPICYYDILIDIEHKRMVKSDTLEFSPKTIVFGKTNTVYLNNYMEVDYDFFKENFLNYETEFTNAIQENLSYSERLDQRPYFMKMVLRYNISVKAEIDYIAHNLESNDLSLSLQSLFGKKIETKKGQKRSILVDSKHINANQLRAVYNAINENLLYVQGPPGTGKTVSITNMVHSSFYNGNSTLIASNNNEAIDNIFKRIDKLKVDGVQIPYPYLRLGNDHYLIEAIAKIERRYQYFKERPTSVVDKNELYTLRLKIKENLGNVSKILSEYEEKLELEENLNTLLELKKLIDKDDQIDLATKMANIIDIDAQIQDYSQKIKIKNVDESSISNFVFDEDVNKKFIQLLSLTYGERLLLSKNRTLIDIFKIESQKERLKEFKNFIKTEDGFRILIDCFPIIGSSNISTLKIGTENSRFDLLIMEEASQCSIVPSLIPMNRSKRACFVGDPQQLQPVVTISEEKNKLLMKLYNIMDVYSYKNNSIMNVLLSVDSKSKFIFLKKHYRCAKKIIDFSNKKYYSNQLEIETQEKELEPLKLINIQNSHSALRNTSISEANEIINEIRRTPKDMQVAIITPFKNQQQLIQQVLDTEKIENIKVSTIHGFQGQESDKIIFSPAITSNTTQGAFDWAKNNKELINVTSTRPRDHILVIADVAEVMRLSNSEMNDLQEFLHYINNNGDYDIISEDYIGNETKVIGYKTFNTESESEFIRTIAQLKSTNQKFKYIPKTRIGDILELMNLKNEDYDLFKYAIKSHFDFVLLDSYGRPMLVVEICGYEHLTDEITMANDLKKVKICVQHNLKILPIFNQDVRRYNEIKRALLSTLSA